MIDIKNQIVRQNLTNYLLYDDLDMENRLFVSWQIFDAAIEYLYEKIIELQRSGKTFDAIYALPRGGLCLGVKLSYMTGLPLLMNHSQLTPQTIVVDDCTNTGKTLSTFKEYFTVVMFHKPTSFFNPNIYYQETDKQINFCWESKEERN
jgi:hypoxanthine phosphoribosyltransferase